MTHNTGYARVNGLEMYYEIHGPGNRSSCYPARTWPSNSCAPSWRPWPRAAKSSGSSSRATGIRPTSTAVLVW